MATLDTSTVRLIIEWIENDKDASTNRQNWRGMAIAMELRKIIGEAK